MGAAGKDEQGARAESAPDRTGDETCEDGSLREMFARHGRAVDDALREALGTSAGLDRVRALHNRVGPAVLVHDSALRWGLCPFLEDVPEGRALSDRLLCGCDERAELLHRFEALSRHVAAHNVYPVSGHDVDQILDDLERSFGEHVADETAALDTLLEATATGFDPELVAARVALEAGRAPSRTHAVLLRHPRAKGLKMFLRALDRLDDWSDTHHNWLEPGSGVSSPRSELVDTLRSNIGAESPSIEEVLEGFDDAVEAIAEELTSAGSDAEVEVASHRLCAAIAIHDSVMGGVLAPLLRAIPGGPAVAAELERGCRTRVELQRSWRQLTAKHARRGFDPKAAAEARRVAEELAEAFRDHERENTPAVVALLRQQPDVVYRTATSTLDDIMWPWHSEGPAVLALHMALWAEAAPTGSHSMMAAHPSSRALRTLYRLEDHVLDYWGDAALERWLRPRGARVASHS